MNFSLRDAFTLELFLSDNNKITSFNNFIIKFYIYFNEISHFILNFSMSIKLSPINISSERFIDYVSFPSR